MRKITLILLILTVAISTNAQQLRKDVKENKKLIEMRSDLDYADALMKKGVFRDNDTGRDYFTGYAYKTLYDWDQYFEAIVQIYMGWTADYIKNGVTIFLDHQEVSGMIARSVPSNQFHGAEHVKPFLAQITMLVFDNYDDTDWFTRDYFKKMKACLDFWLHEMDSNNNGLSEWMSAPHTGMDNQHERAGWWLDRVSEGVDLNSYLVRETQAFARIAELIFNQLLNPEEFWSNYPIPALAISEPGYSDKQLMSDLGCSWRANTWIPSGDGACWDTSSYLKKDLNRISQRFQNNFYL